jgi:hypothetical protein
MSFKTAYKIGQVVYHRLAEERRRGFVKGITVTPEGVHYWVTWPDLSESKHYDIELSAEYVPDYES